MQNSKPKKHEKEIKNNSLSFVTNQMRKDFGKKEPSKLKDDIFSLLKCARVCVCVYICV